MEPADEQNLTLASGGEGHQSSETNGDGHLAEEACRELRKRRGAAKTKVTRKLNIFQNCVDRKDPM